MYKVLKKNGYNTEIYSEGMDERLKDTVKYYSELEETSKDDIIIYHKATGSRLTYELEKIKGIKVFRYHNITPGKYFEKYNEIAYNTVNYGRKGLQYAKKYVDYCLADSEYNADELVELGYKNVEVLPILIPFEDYEEVPDEKIIEKYSDGKKNILFVGRIVPNKAQEDIIKSFYYYNKYINKESRLILIGNDAGFENYSGLLKQLITELEVKDNVIIPGHIKFKEILSYYKIADLFLCMSEHEGFCVPLLESMFFKVPILAYNSSAIKETLGNGGVLVNNKNYFMISELMRITIENQQFREEIIKEQKKRLDYFKLKNTQKRFLEIVDDIIEKFNAQ